MKGSGTMDNQKRNGKNSGEKNTMASHAKTYTTPARLAAQWM